MAKLTMLVGLPASGKSTLAKKLAERDGAIILSSDAIRAELYEDESVQGDPAKVFRIMKERAVHALNEGKDVVYDATNINAKKRTALLKELRSQVSNLWAECMMVLCPYGICLMRNRARDRVVPEEAIERMLHNFQVPYFNEGWDAIFVENTGGMLSMIELVDVAEDFEQCNHYHSLLLGEHLEKTAKTAKSLAFVKGKQAQLVYQAGLYHDIGKLFTQVFHDKNGNPSEDAHYFGHANVSTYYYLTSDAAHYAKQYLGLDYLLTIAFLINWHMDCYQFKQDKAKFDEWAEKRNLDEAERDMLWILHSADRSAH